MIVENMASVNIILYFLANLVEIMAFENGLRLFANSRLAILPKDKKSLTEYKI